MDEPGGVNILREMLYLDVDKVRALLGQLSRGVPEAVDQTSRVGKENALGLKGIGEHRREGVEEMSVRHSMADANFPALEEILDAEGILTDLSNDLRQPERWLEDDWRSATPPGSLVRITLQGSLFDARYIAQQMAAFGWVLSGLQGLGIMPGRADTRAQGKAARVDGEPTLEDLVPAFSPMKDDDGDGKTDRTVLRSIIRVAKGIFTPGLHLIMVPDTGDKEPEYGVTVRLEEGRQYLDTTPEILFARYGSNVQEWTLVGSVGHYPPPPTDVPDPSGVVNSDDSFSRIRMSRYINDVMRFMGGLGFADVPQHPSFAVIPLAVYRTVAIGQSPATTTDLVV